MTTKYETSFYTVEQTANNPVFGHSLIEFLMIPSDDIAYYERSIYNLLDLLGDIGGFIDALDGLATLFLVIFSTAIGDGPHIHMIETVFKTNYRSQEKAHTFKEKLKQISKRKPFIVKQNICLERGREKKMYDKARELAEK